MSMPSNSAASWLFCTDVDNTLLRTGFPVLPKVADAMNRFRAAGGLLALCTGRALQSTRKLAADLKISTPCILYSGAVLFDFVKDSVVHVTTLPADIKDVISRLIKTCPGISVQAYTLERVYLIQETPLLRERGIQEELEDKTTSVEDIKGDIIKLVLTHPEPRQLQVAADNCFDERHYFAFSSRRFAEVVAKGYDKGNGLRLLAAKLGIPMERTFAAGDAMTDAAMFDVCGYSFSPENAPEEVKALCDMVVPSCADGGMAVAFDLVIDRMR